MKKLIFTFLMACTFCIVTQAYGQNKDWTLLVYIIGADLESGSNAGSTDIQEMLDAQSTDFVNVVVLAGGSDKEGWRTPFSFLINNGVETALDFVPTTEKMTDTSSLTEFINWGISNYPSTSVMLTLWNHGGNIRGYGNDEITNSNFTIPTLQTAIGNSDFIMNGNKFDLFGFDACLMANMEALSAFKDFTSYYVASEETEPGHGWNYTPIINYMENDTEFFGDNLGIEVVNSYYQHGQDNETKGLTLGVMDMSKVTELEDKIMTLFNKIETTSTYRSLQKARGKAEEYSKDLQDPEYSQDVVDLGDLMKKLINTEPQLATEAQAVLDAVKSTVIHNRKDNTRPQATGISFYLPHNAFADNDVLNQTYDKYYLPLNIPEAIKTFVYGSYYDNVAFDNTPPSGTQETSFTFSKSSLKRFDAGRGTNLSRNSIDTNFTALRVVHDDDLEQVQLVLMEEFEGFPDEIILLGSTFPDTVVINDDGTETYAYLFDDFWLGINGYPAYITDLQDFEREDEEGNISFWTRIHIPAILNPGTPNERDINIEYSYDEDFNITLESITREVEGQEDDNPVVPKDRVKLVPGDQVQLLYEGFNEVTDEEFFVVDNDAIITIENGNLDLHLEYVPLEVGNYFLGFVLTDHSQNDTLIYDDVLYTIFNSSTKDGFVNNQISMYPNPANESITLEQESFKGSEFTVRIFDQSGKLYFSGQYNDQKITIPTSNMPSGFYSIELISKSTIISDKLIIQH